MNNAFSGWVTFCTFLWAWVETHRYKHLAHTDFVSQRKYHSDTVSINSNEPCVQVKHFEIIK